MEKDQLTFNDLPTVVGELCDRIASMENLLTDIIGEFKCTVFPIQMYKKV